MAEATSRPQLVVAPEPVAPARLTSGSNNSVTVGLLLEIVSLQFSPALQISAIRARPRSQATALQVEAQTLAGTPLPRAGFELDSVQLDARGQIDTIRLAPFQHRVTVHGASSAVSVADLNVLPAGGGAMEIIPGPSSTVNLQLFAAFTLEAVELTPAFTLAHLVLRSQGGKLRVTLQPEAVNSGATFDTAQVLLDRSGRIAEILLDAVTATKSSHSIA